jgi:hypothetical protein
MLNANFPGFWLMRYQSFGMATTNDFSSRFSIVFLARTTAQRGGGCQLMTTQ